MSDVVQTCMSGICIDFGQGNNLQTLLNKQGQFYSRRKRFMQASNKQALPLELKISTVLSTNKGSMAFPKPGLVSSDVNDSYCNTHSCLSESLQGL